MPKIIDFDLDISWDESHELEAGGISCDLSGAEAELVEHIIGDAYSPDLGVYVTNGVGSVDLGENGDRPLKDTEFVALTVFVSGKILLEKRSRVFEHDAQQRLCSLIQESKKKYDDAQQN